MKCSSKSGRAAGVLPASTAQSGPSTVQGVSPLKKGHQTRRERKPNSSASVVQRLPVPVEDVLKRVNPDSQVACVIDDLLRSLGFVDMPFLAGRSGSYNIHCVISYIRRKFYWVIENEMTRCGMEWQSRYRLIAPRLDGENDAVQALTSATLRPNGSRHEVT